MVNRNKLSTSVFTTENKKEKRKKVAQIDHEGKHVSNILSKHSIKTYQEKMDFK